MKVLIMTHGSRGDVQSFVALGKALVDMGHKVVIGAPPELTSVAQSYGIEFVPFNDAIFEFVSRPEVRKATQNNFHGFRGKLLKVRYIRGVRQMMAGVMDEMAALADHGADLVVHLFEQPGHEIAERLGIPAVPVCLQPCSVPTSSFPNILFPFRLPRNLNRASYLWTRALLRLQQGNVAKWRRQTLRLPPRRGHSNPLRRPDGTPATVLQAFSRYILPGSQGYPDYVHTTGFWFLPAATDWVPSPKLTEFLSSGEKPVYVGFGSISGSDPHRTGRIVLEAVRLAGVREVVASGWGGIQANKLPPNVLCIQEAPHEWLFEQVSAVVHHGGAGTTAAALASGRPQVVCPFMGDQLFHARRMQAIGVAPAPQIQRTLNAEELAKAIRQAVADSSLRISAQKLGERIRAEDGVLRAAQILKSVASASNSNSVAKPE